MTSDKEIIPVSQEFIGDVRQIIESGRKQAYAAAGSIALATYSQIIAAKYMTYMPTEDELR